MPATSTLLVVEGVTDKRALFPYLQTDCVVLPSNGKEQLILAYDNLEANLRPGVLFLIDCDGTVDDRLKGNSDLVITVNRDLEADLLFELNALARIACDYLSDDAHSPAAVHEIVGDALACISELAKKIGAIRRAAHSVCARTNIRTAGGQKRKVSLLELPKVAAAAKMGRPAILGAIVDDMAALLNWNVSQKRTIERGASSTLSETCKRHSTAGCTECTSKSYCNGHDLIDALTVVLLNQYGKAVTSETVDSLVRVASDPSLLSSWVVIQRILRWESSSPTLALLAS